MDWRTRCLRQATTLSSRSALKSAALRPLKTQKLHVLAATSTRPAVPFFSSNVASQFTTSPASATTAQWAEEDISLLRNDNAPSSSSPDVPNIPIPPVSLDYPPKPFSAYKPIPALTPRRLLRNYVQLSKGRLTVLNVIVAMSGVALAPTYVGVPILLATAAGTTFCSAAANTINQMLEVPFDAQMARTRNRPLVRRAISPLHAATFAAVTGVAGPAILYAFVNPLTAALGAFNVVLYAGAYTLMKRRTIWNTWVGAIVGAIPAVMGWTAAGGHIFPSASHPIQTFLPSFLTSTPLPLEAVDNPLAPLALFALMFSWQFPHFNPLSHLMRASYAQAGYRMLCVSNPSKNGLVSLRHMIYLLPISSILIPLSGLTTWAFALTSLPINAIALRHAWRFYKEGTDKRAKVLFGTMLWHLPAILGLMMFHKQGMEWSKWFTSKEENVEPVSNSA